jgi:hypothetical protein
MHIEFLIEEASAEVALDNILPKLLPDDFTYSLHPFNGKPDLLTKLPIRLRSYKRWITEEYFIVIIIDEDRKDCHVLKTRLEREAENANLITKTKAQSKKKFQVLNRIIIEELESWFFGDSAAICQAYPRVPITTFQKAKYRDPDAITGGTWEALENILKQAGYFQTGLRKIEAARAISQFIKPEQNKSKSFQVFMAGISAIVNFGKIP